MVKLTKNENLNTYSVGFQGKYDESKYIKITKDFFKTVHHHHYFKKNDFEKILDKIFNYYGEPFSDISMFPTFFISEIAKKKISVVLSGDGGDEIFGGYPNHKNAYQIQIIRKILPPSIRKLIIKSTNNQKITNILKKSMVEDERLFIPEGEYFPEEVLVWKKNKWEECLHYSDGDIIEASIMMDRHFITLPDNFLVKVDRASMANALEVRSPFLDYRFINFSENIPSKWKVGLFKNKKIMKKIVKDIIPKEILNLRKMGFIPPVNEWLEEIREIKDINKFLYILIEKNIISKDIKEFYEKNIFNKKHPNYKEYVIRLFLLKKWMNNNI